MHPGNFFDDIHLGDERLTPRVTVTEGHVLAYAGVAGDFSPCLLYTSDAADE